jgi:acyl carrier protein
MIENSRAEDRLGDPEAQLLSIIQEMIIELRPKKEHRPITLDSSLDRDLGLDSLSRMELLVRIEKKFGVTLSERIFADAETPRDLMRALSGAGLSRAVRKAPEVMTAGEGPVSEPSKAQTLVDVLNWHLEVHPDRPGIRLYEEEETVTYSGSMMEQGPSPRVFRIGGSGKVSLSR